MVLSMRSKSSNDYLGGLNPITSVLIRERRREIWCTQKRRQCVDGGGAETGVIQPQGQECQQPPEAGEAGNGFSTRASGGSTALLTP